MRILHTLRAPIGGLFRHVCDLATVQAQSGHQVGIVCNSSGGGDKTQQILTDLKEICSLGVHRMAMPRLPGPGDFKPLSEIRKLGIAHTPDIVHGHGAKGGLYARLAGGVSGAKAIYTPHGGALHYSWKTPQGALFLSAEKLLLKKTAGLAFVCQFEHDEFERKIGLRQVAAGVVHNGLWPDEFLPVDTRSDASDLLFVGELRALKGVDVLIDVVAQLNRSRAVSLSIVGDGPDRQAFERQVKRLGISGNVQFAGAVAAREAFTRGRIIVIPSRAESFPYIVLEAIAARMPIIATRVGGIPEVLPGTMLVKPNDPNELASILEQALQNLDKLAAAAVTQAKKAAKDLSAHEMGDKIASFYSYVLSSKSAGTTN